MLISAGARVTLEGIAGYHTLLAVPGVSLNNAVVYAKGGFGMTPMSSGLGIAGTIEFSGLGTAPDYRRARSLVEKAKQVLPGLETAGGVERVGYRPFCPDTIPIIDRLPGLPNVVVATGHVELLSNPTYGALGLGADPVPIGLGGEQPVDLDQGELRTPLPRDHGLLHGLVAQGGQVDADAPGRTQQGHASGDHRKPSRSGLVRHGSLLPSEGWDTKNRSAGSSARPP